jgi:hypothetical protein
MSHEHLKEEMVGCKEEGAAATKGKWSGWMEIS